MPKTYRYRRRSPLADILYSSTGVPTPRIKCYYCGARLQDIEIKQVEEDETAERPLFNEHWTVCGSRVIYKVTAACSRCRLFLDNA